MPAAIAIPAIVGGAQAGAQLYTGKRQGDAAERAAEGFSPYQSLGAFALRELQGGFQGSPGYKFLRDEAQGALERSAAAKGTLMSGGFARSLNRSIQGLANSYENDWYGRLTNLAGLGLQGTQGYNANMTDAAAAGAAGTLGAFNTIGSTVGDIFKYQQERDILAALRARGGNLPALNTASSYEPIGGGPRYGRMAELVQ